MGVASKQPAVSIVMPVYNAEQFLPTGLKSILSQSYTDWELIAVDDGSADSSSRILKELAESIEQPVIYHCQENQGGFGARNTGLDLAKGKYIAFFDCDDTWDPHHLKHCFRELESNPDVDWIWGLNRIVDLTNDTIVSESNFFKNGEPLPVTKLKTKQVGKLNVLDDERSVVYQILHGLRCGQQFSLIRREVFDDYRFRASYRNEGADQVSVIRSLNRGFKFGYLNEIHGTYCIHGGNASAGCKNASDEKYLRLRRALIRGFEEVKEEEKLTGAAARAITKRIAEEHFWNIGYNLFWKSERKKEALAEYRIGLSKWPWSFRMWKTYLLALVRSYG